MRKFNSPTPRTPPIRASGLRRRVAVIVAVLLALVCLAVAWRITLRHRAGPAVAPGLASIAVVARGPAARPTKVLTFDQGCRTSECHATMLSAPKLHGPVAQDACDACHGPDVGGHKYPVVKSRETLCRSCHSIADDAPLRHMSLTDDGCIACHDPHTSDGPGLLRAESMEQSCEQCHPAAVEANRHQPYAAGRCDLCHKPHAADARTITASGIVDPGCTHCHSSHDNAVTHFTPTDDKPEGSCVSCHNPHASNLRALLKSEPRDLCTSCHEQVGKDMAGSVTHDAVLQGRQCISCHAPHKSAGASMLVGDQAAVCATCHDRPVKAADGRTVPAILAHRESESFVHGPVASGDCSACHTVHGGNHARLLKRINPLVLGGGVDARNYALCFTCHDGEMLLSESGAETKFRNGPTNLHRLHLASGNGSRTCSSCHVAHAGSRPRLIAESVAYDGSAWKMPMGFVLTADGGSCSPGCHEPRKYNREAKVPLPGQPQRSVP